MPWIKKIELNSLVNWLILIA